MIYLLRHGKDDEDYVGGYSDISLTEEGKRQIEVSAIFIKENLNINKIYTSDIKRAIETAEIVNKYLQLEIEKDQRLRELDKGKLTGIKKTTLTEEERKNLNTIDVNEKIIGGESMKDLYNRINNLYKDGYFFDKDNSLVVTHRGVINMLYFILNQDELSMNKTKYDVVHGSVHELDIKNKKIKRIK